MFEIVKRRDGRPLADAETAVLRRESNSEPEPFIAAISEGFAIARQPGIGRPPATRRFGVAVRYRSSGQTRSNGVTCSFGGPGIFSCGVDRCLIVLAPPPSAARRTA